MQANRTVVYVVYHHDATIRPSVYLNEKSARNLAAIGRGYQILKQTFLDGVTIESEIIYPGNTPTPAPSDSYENLASSTLNLSISEDEPVNREAERQEKIRQLLSRPGGKDRFRGLFLDIIENAEQVLNPSEFFAGGLYGHLHRDLDEQERALLEDYDEEMNDAMIVWYRQNLSKLSDDQIIKTLAFHSTRDLAGGDWARFESSLDEVLANP